MANDFPNPDQYPNPDYTWELNNWWKAQRRRAAKDQQEPRGRTKGLAWPWRGHSEFAAEPTQRYEPRQYGNIGYYGEEQHQNRERRDIYDRNPYLPLPAHPDWEDETHEEYGLEYLMKPHAREVFGEHPHYVEEVGGESRRMWEGGWERPRPRPSGYGAQTDRNLPAFPPEHYMQGTMSGAGSEYGLEYIMRPEAREEFGEHPHEIAWSEQAGQWLPNRPGFAGKGPKNYKRSDDQIEDEINRTMTKDTLLDATDIEVHVDKGAVTLSGSVPNRHMKQIAADIAEGTVGVDFVKNHLKVSNR